MLFSPSKLSQPFRQTSVRNLALAAAVAAALAFAPEKPALAEDMSACDVRRDKAALSSGCKPHPANSLPPEATGAVYGGNEMAEAFG